MMVHCGWFQSLPIPSQPIAVLFPNDPVAAVSRCHSMTNDSRQPGCRNDVLGKFCRSRTNAGRQWGHVCIVPPFFVCALTKQASEWVGTKHCGSQTREIQLEFSSPQWGLGSSEQLHLVSMVLKSCQLIIHQYSYGSSASSFVFSFPSAMQTFSVVALFYSTSGWKHCKM